ncbi:MAG: DUF1223 domain-containing protein [Arenibacterium sp.]
MRLAHLFLAAVLGLAGPLQAQERPVVVELFTSQGCSSCPPADALLHDLAKRSDVIALSLHVDYWDYIGWKDQFADPSHAERQRAYAGAGGRRMIYTPQMIVQGQDSVVGVKPMKLNDLIRAHQAQPPAAILNVEDAGGQQIRVRIAPGETAPSQSADVYVVRFTPLRSADIKRGENAGRKIDYVNVVDDWRLVGEWDGSRPGVFTIDLVTDQPGVILVQTKDNKHIQAARRLR